MDLTDEIEEFIAHKGLSAGSSKTQRSILLSFNKWNATNSSITLSRSAEAYENYLRSRTYLKSKSIEKQVGLVRSFCSWLASTRGVSSFKLDEHLMGNPSFRAVPLPAISAGQIDQMCKVALSRGGKGIRNALMALLAITCGLTAPDIADLTRASIIATDPIGAEYRIWLRGFTVKLPPVASQMFWCYCREVSSWPYAYAPLFPSPSDPDKPMRTSEVRRCIGEALEQTGCKYEEVCHGDPQLAIAQHFKQLDADARHIAAAYVLSVYYANTEMPKASFRKVRDDWYEKEREKERIRCEQRRQELELAEMEARVELYKSIAEERRNLKRPPSGPQT